MKINSSNTTRPSSPPREPAVKESKPAPTPVRTPLAAKDGFAAPSSPGSGARGVPAPPSQRLPVQGVPAPLSNRLEAQKLSGAAASKLLEGLDLGGLLGQPPQVPPAALEGLSPAERAQVQQAAEGTQGVGAQGNLDSVVKSEGFQAMSAPQQARVLQSFLAGPPSSALSTQALTSLVNSAGFRALSAPEQGQALGVFNATDLDGRQHLGTLTDRQVNGQSALLDKDKDGHTLLGDLSAMATGPLAGEFANNGITRADLLSSVMQEAGSPGEINQSNRNTCTVTSMQYMLNQLNPAEYVRVMQGLTSPSGQVQLRGGGTLSRDADSVAPDSATDRSTSERVFQSAMMEYANGSDSYSNPTDQSTRDKKILGVFDQHKTYTGLFSDEEERGLEGLFGKNVDVDKGSFLFHDKQEIVDQLGKRNNQPTLVDLTWGNGGHAVVVEKVENGRVYLRNPWGPTSDAKGTTYSDPPRRLEDGATRLESMSVEDFKKYVRDAYLPH